jgi:hypothetical protein
LIKAKWNAPQSYTDNFWGAYLFILGDNEYCFEVNNVMLEGNKNRLKDNFLVCGDNKTIPEGYP